MGAVGEDTQQVFLGAPRLSKDDSLPRGAQPFGLGDEDAPFALGPSLRHHQTGLDGLAEADLIGEKRPA